VSALVKSRTFPQRNLHRVSIDVVGRDLLRTNLGFLHARHVLPVLGKADSMAERSETSFRESLLLDGRRTERSHGCAPAMRIKSARAIVYRCVAAIICFLIPLLAVIDGTVHVANGQQADFQNGLAEIAAKHGLNQVWFRAEKNGQVLADVGLGGANPDAPIRVASLSKSITAIAIALLIQDGKLSLDSKLGDLLGPMFAQRGHPLDPSLQAITVERLLSHTAGLRANTYADQRHGFKEGQVLRALNEDASVFDFIVASGEDRSNGSRRYVYSNLSYAFLGLIVETVSGESYGDFCRQRIFGPLEIRSATAAPGKYHAMESFAGWQISTGDMIKIWTKAFNRADPSILSASTLQKTLFGKLGEEGYNSYYVLGAYTLGVNILPSKDESSYRIRHGGVDGYGLFVSPANTTKTTSWMEVMEPGGVAWIVACDSHMNPDEHMQIADEVRALVDNTVR
jgi:D-alanyl-D-alanine carboxypeptidase